ncbi:glycosyltransferase family 2 protein [Actinobacillus genomosp. 2]|uniref:glycosyltransferase family 2 protein n=1 Tax=Actinobacillus genomosp. 2 TaxID=230709 RepID=UPI002440FE26|nr:glycosyltransferase family 2 protein [Actinobacillus genomosp. 2]WGE31935.1 glycosyltransferase family 2 protein [Actinobacillus genomosp. 2]
MKNDLPLISIIIPIYNVKPYLEKCINSVLEQSYSNLEIILVDDGATDGSSQVCDEFSEKYENIQVIHKQNGGLSSARNAGIEVMKGEYVFFLDSDDWIAHDIISQLYNDMIEYHADITGTSCYQAFSNGNLVLNTNLAERQILSKKDALRSFLFNNYLTPCAWGKLYKTSLWKDVRFPEGRLFEDQLTIYKVIELAETIIFNPIPKYFYFKRAGSIGHSAFSKKTYDLYEAINEQYDEITKHHPDIESDLAVAKITWEIVFINMMLNSNYSDQTIVDKTRAFARKRILDVMKCEFIPNLRKFQITLFAYNFSLYKVLYARYKKKNPLS